MWPDNYVKGFLRSMSSMFAGGKGSITHMHFDIDLPMSLRAWNKAIVGKIHGGWNVVGMRNIDNIMKKQCSIHGITGKKRKYTMRQIKY